jgi:Ni,Fe-hydrogenase III large subunit
MLAGGGRLAGLLGTGVVDGCELTALVAVADRIEMLRTLVRPDPDGVMRYDSLSREVPAAFWYERALHDLSGVVPVGHPRLDPLLLARSETSPPPRPGSDVGHDGAPVFAEHLGSVDVVGEGMFTLPLGPVRSGVMESIEFLVETPGEDIPYLNIRPHYKHRGIAKQFENRAVDDAVLVAERVEGISSVAHALAFSHAIEDLCNLDVTAEHQLLRVALAELERIANHLDVTMRLADAAGLAVATSRFGWHKERVLRLQGDLTGSRFGRGVIAPGGSTRRVEVHAPSQIEELKTLDQQVGSDIAALERSASFLDRLRTTGPLAHELARTHGALGPIGRASGVDNDVRRERPYDGYPRVTTIPPPLAGAGDALARARVRWHEVHSSTRAAVEALTALGSRVVDATPRLTAGAIRDGISTGSAESAQGEVLYLVEMRDGRVRRCFARSASFHNLVLFHDVFAGDIFTDFPFIEASFGLGYAGVAM